MSRGHARHLWKHEKRFPPFRISGQWLQEAGFDLGQEFETIVHEGRLIINALLAALQPRTVP